MAEGLSLFNRLTQQRTFSSPDDEVIDTAQEISVVECRDDLLLYQASHYFPSEISKLHDHYHSDCSLQNIVHHSLTLHNGCNDAENSNPNVLKKIDSLKSQPTSVFHSRLEKSGNVKDMEADMEKLLEQKETLLTKWFNAFLFGAPLPKTQINQLSQ